LFWKKKNLSEVLVLVESNDARTSFRVCPPLSEPIYIEFRGKSIALKDIGAAGMAFEDHGFNPGDSQHIVFDLPTEKTTLSATVEITHIDPDGMCHCRFLGLDQEGQNAIHRYMLAVQIQEARGKKKAVSAVGPDGRPAGSDQPCQPVPKRLPDGRKTYPRAGGSRAACK
jgi:hypothetical protein